MPLLVEAETLPKKHVEEPSRVLGRAFAIRSHAFGLFGYTISNCEL